MCKGYMWQTDCCRDGVRESHVVTKAFDVEQIDNGEMTMADDGTLFIDDIPANEVSSKSYMYSKDY